MMQDELELNDGKIVKYELKKSRRARRVRITVRPGGKVAVTIPWMIPYVMAKRFVVENKDWIEKKLKQKHKSGPRKIWKHTKNEIKVYKLQARELAETRLEYFNRYYGFEYGRITIRNQSTRWGSCSSRGNLSFNYRIALLPAPLADYLVVHELCHLKEMNHGKRFWSLVERTMPEYKMMRKQLRTYDLV